MQAKQVQPIIFVSAQFATGWIYVWSGIGTIAWNGHTWQGLGQLGKVTPMAETTQGQARGVTLELSGVPSALLGDVLNEVEPQYPAVIYLGYMDSGGNVIATPETRFAGRIDLCRINEGGDTSTIQINVESKLIDLNRARERHYTHQDQQITYPGDNGFMYVNGIQQLACIWGEPGTPINNLPVIGGQSGSGGTGTGSAGGSGNPSRQGPGYR
jgi:hypothetical protein